MALPRAKTRSNVRAGDVGQSHDNSDSSSGRPTWIWIAGGLITSVALAGWGYWRVKYPPPTPDAIWERAQQNFLAGRYEDVAADLDQLGRTRAPTPSDWFLRAELAAINDHLVEALTDLEHVPDDHPVAAEAHLIAGQIERRRNRVRYAEQDLLDAVRLDPRMALARRELIRIYGIQVRRREFNREFQVLASLNTLSFDDVYHWTSVRNNLWEPGDVVEDLLRFVDADPEDRWSRLALADILRRMGRSVQSLRTLSVLPPDDAEALAIRVQIALDLEDGKEADRLLEAGPPGNPTIARLRGRKALAIRDVPAALRNFRIAYADDPDDSETINGLRVACWLSGDETEAKLFKETATNLARLNTLLQRGHATGAKQDLNLMREFGITCAALHRDSEARAWLGLAINGNPLDSEAQKALFRLGAARRAAGGQSDRKP
jgi:tetratricopeptide (TPR) repeat protein